MADEGQMQATSEGQVEEPEVQIEGNPEPQGQAQAAQADPTDWKAEARKWEARSKENKSKAEAYELALSEAKSDTQKASETADEWKAKYDELKAESDRKDALRAAASEYGVDASLLSKMTGETPEEIAENARALAAAVKSAQPYPVIEDKGSQKASPMTLDDIDAIQDEAERRKAYADYYSKNKR